MVKAMVQYSHYYTSRADVISSKAWVELCVFKFGYYMILKIKWSVCKCLV